MAVMEKTVVEVPQPVEEPRVVLELTEAEASVVRIGLWFAQAGRVFSLNNGERELANKLYWQLSAVHGH